MDANADRFLELLHQFEDFTDAISPERAQTEFDETTLQLFWMRWPQVSAWTGSLWRHAVGGNVRPVRAARGPGTR